MTLKFVVLAIYVISTLYSIYLVTREIKSSSNPIPENVADVYNEEEYKKWKNYDNEKTKFSLYEKIATGIFLFLLLTFNAYAAFFGLFDIKSPYFACLLVLAFDTVISTIFAFPFDYYETFSIEERYGFNRYTKKLFLVDKLKSTILELALIWGLMCAFIGIYEALGVYVLILFAGIMVVFVLAMFLFIPYFQKIFYKFTVLEEGSLRERLVKLLSDNGCTVKEIKVVDGSRRSSKANAYFTGLGSTKTIVLYDTLIELMTEDEIVAVFAHEMGHNKNKDTVKGFIQTSISMILMAAVAYLVVSVEGFSTQFGFEGVNYGFAFIVLGILLSLINPLMGLISSRLSCKHEYAADKVAVEQGYGEALISALKKLSKDSLVNLSPDPIVVKLTYSHPPMSERIAAIEKAIKEK